MSDADPIFLAWCAGFFDGEGHVSVKRRGDGGRAGIPGKHDVGQVLVRVSICQKDRRPLDEIAAVFGGCVACNKGAAVSGVYDFHQWVPSSTYAREFLREVIPYLRIKRDAAEQALAVLDARQAQRESWLVRNRELVRLRDQEGWTFPRIAAHFGVATSTAHGIYKRLGSTRV